MISLVEFSKESFHLQFCTKATKLLRSGLHGLCTLSTCEHRSLSSIWNTTTPFHLETGLIMLEDNVCVVLIYFTVAVSSVCSDPCARLSVPLHRLTSTYFAKCVEER